jgi:beta-barrel assembly-enhancing protease
MKYLSLFVSALLLALPPGASAQNINLGSIFDAVKGVAKSQEIGSISEEDEIAIGKEISASTFGSHPIVKNEKLQRYLNTVGLWVAMQSERPSLPWRFAAVQSDQINAYAVPGGAILITSGMLKMLSNEAELACVIGHEVGHIVRKHHIDLLKKETLLQTGTKLLADNIRGGGTKDEAKRFLVGEGSEVFARSLDRDAERDADRDGVLLAARAGYDAGACLLFMQRMASLKQEAGPLASLYKTHPKASERVGDIERAVGLLDGIAPGTGERPALGFGKL